MKNIFKHTPGFRTNTKWKKIVASIYYLSCIISLFSGISAFLIITSLPFILFGLVDLIKYRNKAVILTLIGSILIFSIGMKLDNTYSTSTSTNTTVAASKKAAVDKILPVKHVKTATEITADAKAKKISDARIASIAKAKQDVKIAQDNKIVADARIAANVKAKQVAQENKIAADAKSAETAKAAQVQQIAQSQSNTATQQSSSENNSQMVYITKTGKKYHSAGCRYLRRSEISIKKSEAINEGYNACSVCNP
ncbi:hypothetical protein KPL47_19860 [Clostridium estertheticum]|uniref:hypothetical protein n=1 Tax=Clostridium estertheticum TaxID=238834 RepID=UPI001C0C59C5|nr:hypothetical protein [Clostridium estertheticum]MBU3178575.1 hypothetical protein [Clostridium estertheticum]